MMPEVSTPIDTELLPASNFHVAAMSALLHRLDALLLEHIAAAQASRETDADPLRGLYIAQDEVARLLGPEPARAGGPCAGLYAPCESPRLDRLVQRCGLSELEASMLILALAPELDARYLRIFGFLQDDMTRRRPSVGLALDLICPSRPERLAARGCLAPSAPLLTFDLVRLLDDPDDRHAPLPGRFLGADPWLASYLLGDDELDQRLADFARLEAPRAALDDLLLPDELKRRLGLLANGDGAIGYFQGPDGVGKRSAAQAISRAAGAGALLVVDGAHTPADEAAFQAALRLLRRDALLRGAALYWDGLDALLADGRRDHLRLLLAEVDGWDTPVFLAGAEAWAPASGAVGVSVLRFEFPRLGQAERVRLWARTLDDTALAPDVDPAALVGAFRLSATQIRDAATTARGLAYLRGREGEQVGQADLAAACRAHSAARLGALARRIAPRGRWADLVLPADRTAQLRELCDQARHRATVYERWGFDDKLALGKGLVALFAGPSGTGKTMAASIIAGELGLDMYAIDLSTVVSKYIGETEKNLAKIFAEAETSSAVLFFDEADALFGKRSEVQDAHDRYANLEVAYLLQRIEAYVGIVILATNLRKNIDEAFVRRMQSIVDFPLPGEAERLRIWEQIWPAELPRDKGLDLALVARRFEVPGGSIRNIALGAAFLAAANGGVVGMGHLLHAARREYQKIGKVATERDFALDGERGRR